MANITIYLDEQTDVMLDNLQQGEHRSRSNFIAFLIWQEYYRRNAPKGDVSNVGKSAISEPVDRAG